MFRAKHDAGRQISAVSPVICVSINPHSIFKKEENTFFKVGNGLVGLTLDPFISVSDLGVPTVGSGSDEERVGGSQFCI